MLYNSSTDRLRMQLDISMTRRRVLWRRGFCHTSHTGLSNEATEPGGEQPSQKKHPTASHGLLPAPTNVYLNLSLSDSDRSRMQLDMSTTRKKPERLHKLRLPHPKSRSGKSRSGCRKRKDMNLKFGDDRLLHLSIN